MNHHRLLVSFVLAAAAAWPASDPRSVAADFAVQQKPDRVVITDDGQPVATYVFRDDKILRPYFASVHAPGGIQVTRNHPPVPSVDATDHDTMHPGVWLAFGDLSGQDFWRNKARIVHLQFVEPPAVRDGQVTFTAENAFQAAGGGEICKQTSRLTLAARPAGYLLTEVLQNPFWCWENWGNSVKNGGNRMAHWSRSGTRDAGDNRRLPGKWRPARHASHGGFADARDRGVANGGSSGPGSVRACL
jgi:hypothetical protein